VDEKIAGHLPGELVVADADVHDLLRSALDGLGVVVRQKERLSALDSVARDSSTRC
jgi:hypothetical protein